MKIALVGAPGSNKTALARAILATDKMAYVVDEYVDQFSEHTDIAVSHFADWTTNIQIACERLRIEQRAEAIPPTLMISCGTVIDTLAYTAVRVKTLDTIQDRNEQAYELNKAVYTTQALALLFKETWNYDLTFYLPLGLDAWSQSYDAILDRELPLWLEDFFVAYTRLEGSTDEQARAVTEAIATHQDRTAEPAESAER